jgi:hypothetical protein
VIVRIAGAGQYRLPDEQAASLNELDNEAVSAVEAGDETRFRQALDRMIDLVHSKGEPLPSDDLTSSDVILPPPDISLAEAAADFTGDGLIPEPN